MQFHQLKRRDFISLVGSAAAWPIAARGQQQAMPVIGYLYPGLAEANALLVGAFRRGLGEHGYVEGRNVAIEYRLANAEPSRLADLAADLVRRRVAVIAAVGGSACALAAKAASATIPIVFEVGSDPVEDGLVASFNRPGGNLTGITPMNFEIDVKRLGLLCEVVPTAERVGVLIADASIPANRIRIQMIQPAAAALGRQIEVLSAGTSRAIDDAFASLAQRRVGALLVASGSVLYGYRVQIATAAARYSVPAIYWDRSMAEVGGLMSYGANVEEIWRAVGVYSGRILKGDKPSDLPVLRPTRFDFVINLQTARLLRIVFPPTLLALATDVIE
jgi:putative ABC transport system substrate-binding protein